MSERYHIHATVDDAETEAQLIWDSYYERECARRGLRVGVDSLDTRRGRVLPLPAVTERAANVKVVDGTPLLCAPGTDEELEGLSETATLVEREALPQRIQDALDGAQVAAKPARVRL